MNKPKPMSARKDDSSLISYSEPLPEVGKPVDVRAEVGKIIVLLEGILSRSDVCASHYQRVASALTSWRKIEASFSTELPGLESVTFKKTKARGTREEVIADFKEIGLRAED